MSEQIKYDLTPERKKELEKEMRFLIEVKRPEILEQIKSAREQGDLSENAEYESARTEQGKIETRIRDIQEYLDHASIIKSSSGTSKKIRMGTTFTILDLSDKSKNKFRVVGEIEADPMKGMISNDSPLFKALMDKTEGAEVEVRGIEHPYKVRVLEVE